MSKGNVLKAIKRQCAECMGNHPGYVRGCTSVACPLFPYRLGSDPGAKKEFSEEQRVELIERFTKAKARIN